MDVCQLVMSLRAILLLSPRKVVILLQAEGNAFLDLHDTLQVNGEKCCTPRGV